MPMISCEDLGFTVIEIYPISGISLNCMYMMSWSLGNSLHQCNKY